MNDFGTLIAAAFVAGNAPILIICIVASAAKRGYSIGVSIVAISWAFGGGVAVVARAKGWI